MLVNATLADSDMEVLVASNGEETLRAVREQAPDLILLDVMMPGLDGFAVCRAIKSDPATSQVKIVMLTARGQASDVQRAQQAGADRYFVKPFSPSALLAAVGEILGWPGSPTGK